MNLWRKVSKVSSKVTARALGFAATPVKVVGGATAKFLGSKATLSDFDRGIKAIAHGKVSAKVLNRALQETGSFVAHAPAGAVRSTGKVVAEVAKAGTEAAGNLLKSGLSGLFAGGGLPLLLLLAVAGFLAFKFLEGGGPSKMLLGKVV